MNSLNHKKITLGILHRNDEKLAKLFMDKLFSSEECEAIKIVWIDNASSDASASLIEPMMREGDRFVKSDINLGVIGGRNLIFDIFSTQDTSHLIFLDNDQLVSPGWLENYISSEHFSNSVCGLEAWQLDANMKPFKMCGTKDSKFSYVGCGGMSIPRICFERLGKFDQDLGMAYFEDPDYCFRAFDVDIPVKWVPNKFILHLAHQTLGKMPNRNAMFSKSAQHFRNKWRNRKDLIMRGSI